MALKTLRSLIRSLQRLALTLDWILEFKLKLAHNSNVKLKLELET